MSSSERKERVLKALYAAASNPKEHDTFTQEFDSALEELDRQEFGAWLEPHVETATSIFEQLNFAGVLEPTSHGIVQKFSEPTAIVTIAGDIVASNAGWEALSANNHLDEITDIEQDRADMRTASQSLHAISEDRTKIVRLRGAAPSSSILTFRRLPASDDRSSNGGSILVRSLGLYWSDLLLTLMREQFKLTDVELTVFKQIVDGQSFADIAASLDRGRETVKSHATSIYAKLDVSGREDLVRFTLQLQNLLGQNPRQSMIQSNGASRGATIELASSQRLYYEEKGAPSGRRILFLHGLSLGHHFSEAFEAELAKANLTLLCIDRPGYGRSDPPKNWKKGLEEWIDLFPDLMRRFGLERSPIVTQTGGVMLASAAAAYHPKLVSGICAFAAGIPITDRHNLSQYPPQIRIVSRAARLSPTILRFLIANGTQYFRTPEGRDRIIDRSYAMSPVDRDGLQNPKTRDQVRASIQMIADGGFDGFISDNLHVFGDWSRFPKRVRCEIAYLNGSEDPVCPIAWSREFAKDVPNMTVAEAEGAGNLMLHTHPDRCIGHLVACLERFDQNNR
ncbi:MAG: alpha/beta fold hydrolase [Pseudomonadota bacterium]